MPGFVNTAKQQLRKLVKARLMLIRIGRSQIDCYDKCKQIEADLDRLLSDRALAQYILRMYAHITRIAPPSHRQACNQLFDNSTQILNQ